MMTAKDAKKLAKKTLSEKRYEHTCNVENLAVKLAKKHGADTEKVSLAAFLHDIAKELPKDKLLQIFVKNDIMTNGINKRPQPVWHGIAGAIIAKEEYGIDDEDVLNAIACHTTGRENMTLIDKIIYIADMAGEDRDYPEAEETRKNAMKNIDKTIISALGQNIEWLKAEGKQVDKETLKAYRQQRKIYYSHGE